jgi:hypothetical protein
MEEEGCVAKAKGGQLRMCLDIVSEFLTTKELSQKHTKQGLHHTLWCSHASTIKEMRVQAFD